MWFGVVVFVFFVVLGLGVRFCLRVCCLGVCFVVCAFPLFVGVVCIYFDWGVCLSFLSVAACVCVLSVAFSLFLFVLMLFRVCVLVCGLVAFFCLSVFFCVFVVCVCAFGDVCCVCFLFCLCV